MVFVLTIFLQVPLSLNIRKKFSDPKTREETLEMIPAREIGEAQDVANVALFLASDLASYIHGTTLYVDGGMTNYPAFMGGKG